ncbi:hypothetical protein HJC23_002355 [Cyclotella cryptica]|uniref:Uncharacterized protein n=1 Tax=Cyclotella cryptica TaxID=29204 RepID=A0ABD3QLF9_9STRA|eukprot:CCRYP_004450-RA/>CCRYP_004450-RA protein AED:0.36 eAED:0.36 QI:0/-1/0/1/-1/1/1/0/256
MKFARKLLLAYAASLPIVATASDLNTRADSKLRGSDKKNMNTALEEDVAFWTNFQRNLQGMSLPYGNGAPSGGEVVRPPSTSGGGGDGARPTPFPSSMGSTISASSFPTSVGSAFSTSLQSPMPTASGGASNVQSSFPTSGAAAGSTTTFPTAVMNGAGTSSFPTSNFNSVTSSFPTSNMAATAFPTAGLQATTASVGFVCPPASFVGCTAPDPLNPTDECSTVGEPCVGGNSGEFCCQDACPRNYCTAKGAPSAK